MPKPSRPYSLAIHGPFEIPHHEVKIHKGLWQLDHSKLSIDGFWKDLVGNHGDGADIGGKDGCYVFAMRASKGFQPWYVGKTKRSLRDEVFTDRNILIYNEILMEMTGTPVLFLVTNAEPGRSNLPSDVVDRLETDLIRHASKKNPRLKNERKRKDKVEYKINGVGTQGRAGDEAVKFKKMMGMT